MSLWNPRNVFSNPERGGTTPSSAFDPSRTGDPLRPGHDGPDVGFGSQGAGAPTSAGHPHRRPIGFAPPTDDARDERRFSTELSFKRHQPSPRASTTPDGPSGGTPEPWLTPDQIHEDAAGAEPVVTEQAAPEPEATTSVPFYKREIGFGRKRQAAPEPDPVEEQSDDAADAVVAPEPVDAVDVVAASELFEPAPATEAESELVAPVADVADGAADDVEAKSVPFYKREISFRRKPAASSAVVEATDEASEARAPADDEATAETGSSTAAEIVDEPVGAMETETEPVTAADVADVQVEAVEAVEAVAAESDSVDVPVATADSEEAPDEMTAESDTETDVSAAADPDEADRDSEPAEIASVAEADGGDAAPEHGQDPVALADEPHAEPDAEPDPEPELAAESPSAESADVPAAASGRFARRRPGRAPKDKRRSSRGQKGRRVVGLKVGASQISAAVVNETEAGHELVQVARRPLAAGIVVDGEIRDSEALSLALASFFEDEKLPRKDVRIGVSSNRIGVRTFDIVGVQDETRFDNAVRFKAHELLPLAVQESVLDYRVLDERPNEDGEIVRRVLLAVAPRDQVEPYARVAQNAGLGLAGIDLEALALLRAFVAPKPAAAGVADDTATVVVAIGHESSTLLVAAGGACEFTRVFDWGGSDLEAAIATALEVEQSDAASILKHLSLSGPGLMLDTLDDEARVRAVDAVRLRLTPFTRELVNSLQFYQTQDQSLGIGGIVVTGGTSHLEGLDAVLHQMIGVNVEIGDPLARVVVAGELDPAIEAVIGSMAVPIGLAVDDVATRGLNLISGTTSRKKRSVRSTPLAVAAPVAIAVPLAALAFLYFGAHGSVSSKQAELDAVSAEMASLPVPTTPRIAPSIVGDEAVRATAVANLLGGRVAWDAVFRDLSRVLPDDVWLQSLSLTQPEPTGALPPGAAPAEAGGPAAVNIDGYTFEQPDVARLLARLATLPSLTRVSLVSSEQTALGAKEVVHFVIVADLKNAGGAS